MTDAEVAAIAARAETATPGEWIVHEWTGEVLVYHQSGTQTTIAHYPATKADAAFIAHARADIPALLAERAVLLAEVEQARPIIERLARGFTLYFDDRENGYVCTLCDAAIHYEQAADDDLVTGNWTLIGWREEHIQHEPDCPVLQARALLAGD